MTQKQLDIAVGFDEKSADVRIAQYESGTRTPKRTLVEKLAEVLDVPPRFLSDDEILGAEGLMKMLFELDEYYPISIEDCKDEDGNQREGVCFGSILMTDLLSEWQRRKKDLADGKISKVEYTDQFSSLLSNCYHEIFVGLENADFTTFPKLDFLFPLAPDKQILNGFV